jgi:hypothetical protein
VHSDGFFKRVLDVLRLGLAAREEQAK